MNKNLCPWGDKINKTASVDNMFGISDFTSSKCPSPKDPQLVFNPKGPFCYDCNPSGISSGQDGSGGNNGNSGSTGGSGSVGNGGGSGGESFSGSSGATSVGSPLYVHSLLVLGCYFAAFRLDLSG